MLMRSRLLYGMSNECIVPRALGTVHPLRRTPWASILFTSVIAIILVSTVDIGVLGGTTALLLLVVFAIVNVAVLVPRKEKVNHPHFRAPTLIPALAALFCLYLVSPLSGRPARDCHSARRRRRRCAVGDQLGAAAEGAGNRHRSTGSCAVKMSTSPDRASSRSRC